MQLTLCQLTNYLVNFVSYRLTYANLPERDNVTMRCWSEEASAVVAVNTAFNLLAQL